MRHSVKVAHNSNCGGFSKQPHKGKTTNLGSKPYEPRFYQPVVEPALTAEAHQILAAQLALNVAALHQSS